MDPKLSLEYTKQCLRSSLQKNFWHGKTQFITLFVGFNKQNTKVLDLLHDHLKSCTCITNGAINYIGKELVFWKFQVKFEIDKMQKILLKKNSMLITSGQQDKTFP